MRIHRCTESDIRSTGAFYDRGVLWLDDISQYSEQFFETENRKP